MTLPVYVAVGSDPDDEVPGEPHVMEVFLTAPQASGFVLDAMMQALRLHRDGRLKRGEQISLLLTLGEGEGDDERMTYGSVAVQATDHRHVWDFRVEKRWTRLSPF